MSTKLGDTSLILNFNSKKYTTRPYMDQMPGTSGLRKKVKRFEQEHYTQNFIQAILTTLGDEAKNAVLVVGGDGRYYSRVAIDIIVAICAANRVGTLIIGERGILSTPAVSNLIRRRKATGGIILTASHNPGGPNKDFGIKYNVQNGGPAPTGFTNRIYHACLEISEFRSVDVLTVPVTKPGVHRYKIDGEHPFTVEVIDSVKDYVQLMKDCFDFDSLRALFKATDEKPALKILIDCMNGVTGPYAQEIFVNQLGAPDGCILNNMPLDDFGGQHPDPNLTYAASLVNAVKFGDEDFGAAYDGDGDRNMILGKHAFFVTPSDSLAVIASFMEHIPYFRITGIKGLARSMPTAAAVDRVAQKKDVELHEVPTGWKYFGNLMDANRLSLCGEESFGTGSDHIREKDGIWASLAWLQIIALEGKSVETLVKDHWLFYGRNFFRRFDYEDCDGEQCKKMMACLEESMKSPEFVGLAIQEQGKTFVVKSADEFQYSDPIDGSLTLNAGTRIIFEDGSRIVIRLSGTGSTGNSTVRIYMDSYERKFPMILKPPEEALGPLIAVALKITQIREFTGRDEPTVIT